MCWFLKTCLKVQERERTLFPMSSLRNLMVSLFQKSSMFQEETMEQSKELSITLSVTRLSVLILMQLLDSRVKEDAKILSLLTELNLRKEWYLEVKVARTFSTLILVSLSLTRISRSLETKFKNLLHNLTSWRLNLVRASKRKTFSSENSTRLSSILRVWKVWSKKLIIK